MLSRSDHQTLATSHTPMGIATDTAGNVYFARNLDAVFKLDPTGALTRVVGCFLSGYARDDGPATSARLALNEVIGLADGAGTPIPATDASAECLPAESLPP
jgi:hypothetical protein